MFVVVAALWRRTLDGCGGGGCCDDRRRHLLVLLIDVAYGPRLCCKDGNVDRRHRKKGGDINGK